MNETFKKIFLEEDTNKKEKMLTTIDNPYSPFKEFDKWLNYDAIVLKYNTCQLLSRMYDAVQEQEPPMTEEETLEFAIKKIIENDFDKKYKLVYQ